jgi:hypothetical protein
MKVLRCTVLLVLVTSSYVTLLAFAPGMARKTWWVYAIITTVLSGLVLWGDYQRHRRS